MSRARRDIGCGGGSTTTRELVTGHGGSARPCDLRGRARYARESGGPRSSGWAAVGQARRQSLPGASRARDAPDPPSSQTAAAAPNAPPQAGYAPDDRSTCRDTKCKAPISRGALRLGKRPPAIGGYSVRVQWYHPQCIWRSFERMSCRAKTISGPHDIEELCHLKAEDRAIVEGMVSEYVQTHGQNLTGKALERGERVHADRLAVEEKPTTPPPPSLAARVEDAPAARGVGGGCERITREEAVAIVAKRRGRAAPGETVCAQNGVKSQEPAGTTPPVRDAAQPGQKRLKVSDADSNTIEALLCLRETNGTSDKQRGS